MRRGGAWQGNDRESGIERDCCKRGWQRWLRSGAPARIPDMRARSLLFSILLTYLLSLQTCFGLAGELTSPSLAFPADSPLAKPVYAIISDKEFHFLHGMFINAHTTLEYTGDAASLNKFLDRLSQCHGVTLHVTFASSDSEAAWVLSHSAWGAPDSFSIAVNTSKIEQRAVHVPGAAVDAGKK